MFVINYIIKFVLLAVCLGLISVSINILLIFLQWCSVRRILFLYKIRGVLCQLPDDTLLKCHGKNVMIIRESSVNDNFIPFYSGVLTWKTGNKIARRVKDMVKNQLLLRVACLFAIVVTLLYTIVWLIIEKGIGGIIASVVLIGIITVHQIWPFKLFIFPRIFDGLFQKD